MDLNLKEGDIILVKTQVAERSLLVEVTYAKRFFLGHTEVRGNVVAGCTKDEGLGQSMYIDRNEIIGRWI